MKNVQSYGDFVSDCLHVYFVVKMEPIDPFKKQCGEIYLLATGNMTFHCTLCENKFAGFGEFARHVNLTHQQEQSDYIKEEISEDNEDSILPMPMDNDSDDEKPNIISDVETSLCEEEGELTFEVSIVEPNAEETPISNFDQRKQGKLPRSLNIRKEGKPKEIVPRRPRNIDINDYSSTQNHHFCTECEYSTNIKVKLEEHVRRHFGDRPFKCDFCEQRFYTRNEKTRHTARQHPETVEPKKLSPEKIELKALIKSSLIDLGNNKFQCKECNFTSEGRSSMWYHIRRHSPYKPYKCTICPKTFYTSNELNTHIRSHTGEKPYLCTECGSAFSTSSKLNIHLKRHNNIRDKECPICQRRFFNKRQLQSHMAVHSDERPFVCDMCPSTFKRRKTLSSHMKIHVNGRAFQCEICDAGFNQHAGLLIHIRAKHTLTSKEHTTNSNI